MLKINQPAPEFMAKAYHQDAIKEISLKGVKARQEKAQKTETSPIQP